MNGLQMLTALAVACVCAAAVHVSRRLRSAAVAPPMAIAVLQRKASDSLLLGKCPPSVEGDNSCERWANGSRTTRSWSRGRRTGARAFAALPLFKVAIEVQ